MQTARQLIECELKKTVRAASIYLSIYLSIAVGGLGYGQDLGASDEPGTPAQELMDASSGHSLTIPNLDAVREWERPEVSRLPSRDLTVDSFDKDYVVDLGDLIGNRKYLFQLNMKNETNQPVILNEVKTSCGCMAGFIRNETLRSGDIGDVRILISTPNKVSPYGVKVLLFDEESPPIRLFIKAQIQSPVQLEPTETLRFEVDSDNNSQTTIRMIPKMPNVELLSDKLKTVGRADLIDVRVSDRELELLFEAKKLSEKDLNLVQKVLVVYTDHEYAGVEFEWQLDLLLEIEGIAAIYPSLVPLRETEKSISGRFVFLGSPRAVKEQDSEKGPPVFSICIGESIIHCDGTQLAPTKWLIRFESSNFDSFAGHPEKQSFEGEFRAGSTRLPIRFARGL